MDTNLTISEATSEATITCPKHNFNPISITDYWNKTYLVVEYNEEYDGNYGKQLYDFLMEIDSKYDIQEELDKYKINLVRG